MNQNSKFNRNNKARSGVRINDKIRAKEVRLIGKDGSQLGIVPIVEALKIASESGLDLVEIAPEAKPPVCRLLNYGKYLFEKNKRDKKKSKQVKIKEIKMRPGTDIGDYSFKLKRATEFLQEGNKVKFVVRFRGREMAHQELGMDVLKRVMEDLSEYTVEQSPKMEGRQIVMVVGVAGKNKKG